MPIVAADPSIDVGGVDPQPVIVFADGERSMGLAVHSIEDVVQDTVRIEMNGNRPGILGTSVINGSATEVIDIHHYIQQSREDWFQNIEPENVGLKLLVVDDSSFFQNLLGPILMSAGHDVVFAGDGEEAMQTLSSGPSFDLVLSDIERPNVNGLQLAARIRENPYHCDLPLIALTGQGSEEIGQRALDAGFNDYLVKVDKDAVLGCLNDYYHSLKRALV
jgi:two-component system chemotaxis sensor kinase CheA